MFKNKRILIIGAGQIGEACAVRFSKDEPKEIILHTLTQEEATQAIKNVQTKIAKKIKLTPSWGNILVPKELIYTKREELLSDNGKLEKLINYYYANLSSSLLANSALYKIIKKWKPNVIVDAVNTATVVGYLDDPYSLPRSIMADFKNKNGVDWQHQCKKILSSTIIPSLIRFTQVLQKALLDFKVDTYVKVSTTGLGGMGINLMYTHGDLNEPGMSSGILGKVSAAGIFHQLMWSLSHTPGTSIRIVVPAALVGWQAVSFGKFRSHGKNPFVVDNLKIKKIEYGKYLKPDRDAKITKKHLEIPFVDSGENSAYSLYEMHAITALGQMESITKEEVAEAVYESAKGSTKHDLLTAMDYAALPSTYTAAFQRKVVLSRLKGIQEAKKTPSIATNNLGPTVSKHLFELYILFKIAGEKINRILSLSPEQFSVLAKKYIMKNGKLRSQILSLGLPILFNKDEFLNSNHIFVPDCSVDNVISPAALKKWADAGWVDLRPSRFSYWKKWIKIANNYSDASLKKEEVSIDRNYKALESGNVGEVLGLLYSIQGGEKRKEY
jgi:hypothetical protein